MYFEFKRWYLAEIRDILHTVTKDVINHFQVHKLTVDVILLLLPIIIIFIIINVIAIFIIIIILAVTNSNLISIAIVNNKRQSCPAGPEVNPLASRRCGPGLIPGYDM